MHHLIDRNILVWETLNDIFNFDSCRKQSSDSTLPHDSVRVDQTKLLKCAKNQEDKTSDCA